MQRYPLNMISLEETKVIERNARFFGISSEQLMENAGRAVAGFVRDKFAGKKLVICGPGNNGGDGFVVARLLGAKTVLVTPPKRIKSSLAKRNYEKVKERVKLLAEINLRKAISEADLIIDAMLGIGIKGELREPYRKVASLVNESGKKIIAIDVPTGFGAKNAVKPDFTVTFHAPKKGMNSTNSGKIVVNDIGMREGASFVGPGELLYYPKPKPNTHKGDNGVVVIVGGGPYTGAPGLAGLAAYRTGVDLVHIATPQQVYPILSSFSPNFIVHPLSENRIVGADVRRITDLTKKADAVLVGPGLGAHGKTIGAVKELVKLCKIPLVLDANAFDALSVDDLKGKKGVVTPHRAEFKKLTGLSLSGNPKKDAEFVKEQATNCGMTMLLKAPTDIISDGKRIKFNKLGTPAMTVGGTGDVLAGIIVGLLARGVEPFNAARIAAFINARAGELAFNQLSYGMLATDLIEFIPNVLREFLSE